MLLLSPTLSTNITVDLFWAYVVDLIPGKFKRDPRTGTLLIKPTTTGKKPLNKRKNP